MATINDPDWQGSGKQQRDIALTGVQLSNLQELLDNQANAASCLQLSYLSTSSMPQVQDSIRDAAMRLWSADGDATIAISTSTIAAKSVMKALPDAFELLKSPDTITFAQDMLSEMADEAHRVQAQFTKVAKEYSACADLLIETFDKGNISRDELERKVQAAKVEKASAEVFAKSNDELVASYNKQLESLKQQQDEVKKQEDDVITKAFTMDMTKIVMSGVTGMMKAGAEAFVTATNPELVMGSKAADQLLGGKDKDKAGGGASGGSTTAAAQAAGAPPPSDPQANANWHIQQVASATQQVNLLKDKLAKVTGSDKDAEDARAAVQKNLDQWKTQLANEQIAVSDAQRAISQGTKDDGSPASGGAWDLAKDIEARAKVLQERQRDAEARRAAAQALVIQNQAKLAALAAQAEYDEPHLEQIKEAVANLASASTSVKALAVFWQGIQGLLESLASKNDTVAKPDFLGALSKLPADAYVRVVNLRVTPGLVTTYGYWWAVLDICSAYSKAASTVIDATAGKSLYQWTSAAPGTPAQQQLLIEAVAKAKEGMPIMQAPTMDPVQVSSISAPAA